MDQSVGGHAAQCFARLRSLGVGTISIPSESRRGYQGAKGILFQKCRVKPTLQEGMCKVIPRWTMEEQARRECNPNQSPNTWKTYVRAPFVVSIDLDQLDFKDQSGVCWDDRWETAGSICLQMLQISNCMLSVKLRT
jgi:hypothetical protein